MKLGVYIMTCAKVSEENKIFKSCHPEQEAKIWAMAGWLVSYEMVE
jgi:hypothetical protein